MQIYTIHQNHKDIAPNGGLLRAATPTQQGSTLYFSQLFLFLFLVACFLLLVPLTVSAALTDGLPRSVGGAVYYWGLVGHWTFNGKDTVK